ncbi:MAG: hypothetical protein R3C03_23480 [Pirellulaceae bacterium]
MTPKTAKQIRHNPSRLVTHFEPADYPDCQKWSNPAQSVTCFGDGSVTDFKVIKAHKNREKLSLYSYPSRCHAHPRAMRAHAYKGGVTDKRDGIDFESQYQNDSAVRSCGMSSIMRPYKNDAGRVCNVAARDVLGTSAATQPRVGRGNGHPIKQSLFYLSELGFVSNANFDNHDLRSVCDGKSVRRIVDGHWRKGIEMVNDTTSLISRFNFFHSFQNFSGFNRNNLGVFEKIYYMSFVDGHQVSNGRIELGLMNQTLGFNIPNSDRNWPKIIFLEFVFVNKALFRTAQDKFPVLGKRGGTNLSGLARENLRCVQQIRLLGRLLNVPQTNGIERMPNPSCAEQVSIRIIYCQPRMKVVCWFAILYISEPLAGLGILDLNLVVLFRTVNDDIFAIAQLREAYRVFINVCMIEAAVKFPDNTSISEQYSFGSQAFVNDGILARLRTTGGIKPKAISHRPGNCVSVQIESRTTPNPIHQLLPIPDE